MLCIEVENLELAKELLPTIDSKVMLQAHLPGALIANSTFPDQLVDGSSHGFLQAMYYSYSEHRPFILSPESIWLLVLQAFSTYLNNNPKNFKNRFPRFKNKRKLSIQKDYINWSAPKEVETIINDFCSELDLELEDGFVDKLSGTFSGTDLTEETVFKITTLNTVKSFFEFIVVTFICGIPKIYLSGNQADWENLGNRLNYLDSFGFSWLTDQVRPIVYRISKEFEGTVQDGFWMNMFKIHTKEDYGKPKIVDGWITKFFPFTKTGERTTKAYFETTPFEYLVKDLNPQFVELDFLQQIKNEKGRLMKEVPLRIIAGFIGIQQETSSLALKPQLGWALSKRTESLVDLAQGREHDILTFSKLEDFPKEVLTLKRINELILNYEHIVDIPPEITQVEINILRINGKLNRKLKRKIRVLFENRDAFVLINGENVKTRFKDKVKYLLYRISPFHKRYIHY